MRKVELPTFPISHKRCTKSDIYIQFDEKGNDDMYYGTI